MNTTNGTGPYREQDRVAALEHKCATLESNQAILRDRLALYDQRPQNSAPTLACQATNHACRCDELIAAASRSKTPVHLWFIAGTITGTILVELFRHLLPLLP